MNVCLEKKVTCAIEALVLYIECLNVLRRKGTIKSSTQVVDPALLDRRKGTFSDK